MTTEKTSGSDTLRMPKLGSAFWGAALSQKPLVFDPNAVQQFRESFGKQFDQLNAEEQNLCAAVASCSPYLRRLMIRAPEFTLETLRVPPSLALLRACRMARSAGLVSEPSAQMSQLRKAKDAAALSIALADIAGAWEVMTAARAVSIFADVCVGAALGAASVGAGFDRKSPGLTVLAMGKHGAWELNYSSDIDVVVLFDREKMGEEDYGEAQKRAVTITREMVNLLHTQTADGYVFRTDLRLRPDPGVTAVALSIEAAETYYEAYGQNWERMAYIKARSIAGDKALGGSFIETLRPFIWRKYFDFASIDDVKAVKRQIHSAKGGHDIEFEGHDVKLGRGGIREIEFYAQTQQLILGGKDPTLRKRATLEALAALRDAGHVSAKICEELSAAYRYLREVEHRLQMINDEQTHSLPKQPDDIDRIARFLGEADTDQFRMKMLAVFQLVKEHFDGLFESEVEIASSVGPLVFTGVSNDPATIVTLGKLGFQRASEVSDVIRRWHSGGVRATRTERARNLLTKLMKPLIEALSKANNPDHAFFAIDDFFQRLPAGVQVFSLLASNVGLFEILIRIMTISPVLGRELSKRINFVEQLIDKSWVIAPELDFYGPSLLEALAPVDDYEDALNESRRWAGEQKFLIAAQLATQEISSDVAARHFSAIAEASINALIAPALLQIKRQHGSIEGELVVIGLGRLGAGEMTATSDVDVVFIYEAAPGAVSDGARPLTATEYYTRLVRRIVTAISATTQEGRLYEVDMQLRPSGRAGPAAISLSAFQRYYEQDAWTWELMALTKARLIASLRSPSAALNLATKVEQQIVSLLVKPRDPDILKTDVHDMRCRLMTAKPATGIWDVKNIWGGLTDIAFICQYLQLRLGADLKNSPKNTSALIRELTENGQLAPDDGRDLGQIHAIFEAILQVERASIGGVFDPKSAGEALQERMSAICEAQDMGEAVQLLTEHQSVVQNIYHRVLGKTPL